VVGDGNYRVAIYLFVHCSSMLWAFCAFSNTAANVAKSVYVAVSGFGMSCTIEVMSSNNFCKASKSEMYLSEIAPVNMAVCCISTITNVHLRLSVVNT